MTENKKIKKLQKVNRNSTVRFKKSHLRPERAQTGSINRPPKFYNEKDVYMMESDLVFSLKDDGVLSEVSMLNVFKHITSVEIRKDLSEKIVTLRLEPQLHPPITCCDKITKDLEENEEPAIKDWVESLNAFGSKYESFTKGFENFLKETPMEKKIFMKEQSAVKRLTAFSNYPAFEIRYRMKKEEVKCTELCFNETFIQEAGYTIETFTSSALTEGLPQLFPPDSPAIITTIKGFMKNLNYTIDEKKLPTQEADLLMKTGQRKRIEFEPVILMELSEMDLIVGLIFVVKMKSQPFGSYQKQSCSQGFLEIRRDNNKEKEYLFSSYYRGKSQSHRIVTDRVCKIRELPLLN